MRADIQLTEQKSLVARAHCQGMTALVLTGKMFFAGLLMVKQPPLPPQELMPKSLQRGI